jgi:hypothetical protein
MNSTTTDFESLTLSSNRAFGHYYKGGVLTPAPDTLPYHTWPYTFSPAGGINTNIDDFSKWLLFLTNDGTVNGKRLISKNAINRVFSKRIYNKQQNNYYCLGWRLSEHKYGDNYWHGGTTDMQGAYISFIRDKSIGIVVLMNLNNVPAAEAISLNLYDLYFNGDNRTDWSKKALARSAARRKNRDQSSKKPKEIIKPLPLENYIGKYSNNLYGIVEVRLINNKLRLSAGTFKTWLTLTHYNKNSFGAESIPGWNFKKPDFRFIADKNSKITSMSIDDMSDGVNSVFYKIKQ